MAENGNATNCPICFISYEDNYFIQRRFPCGFILCEECVENVLIHDENFFECPSCKMMHVAQDGASSSADKVTVDEVKGESVI